jgi:hypothetical protein
MTDQAALIKWDLEKWFIEHPSAAEKLIKLGLLNTTRGNKKRDVSLRKLDFLVSGLAQNEPLLFPCKGKSTEFVNLSIAYAQAKFTFKKKRLDAFKRSPREPFNINGKIIHSTLGQVNFFRLIFNVGAMDYVLENINKIEQKMKVSVKEKQTKASNKRKGKKRKSTQVCFGQSKRPKKETGTL